MEVVVVKKEIKNKTEQSSGLLIMDSFENAARSGNTPEEFHKTVLVFSIVFGILGFIGHVLKRRKQ